MRKLIALLSIASIAFMTNPSHAADTPSGCPSTWGMKLVDGVESTGVLEAAKKSYGAGKMYASTQSAVTVGNYSIQGIDAIRIAEIDPGPIWSILAKAIEQNAPIVFDDALTVKFEGCPDFTMKSERSPISVVVQESPTGFEGALNYWADSYGAVRINNVMPLAAKDDFRERYSAWLSSVKIQASITNASSNNFQPLRGFSLGSNKTGYVIHGVMLVPQSGRLCTYMNSNSPTRLQLTRGCTYDAVIPYDYATTVGKFVAGQTIRLVKVESIAFQPMAPKKLTITCKKGKLSKIVSGKSPQCPKGYLLAN